MIGFSFGGAVICGTLQLMSGGTLDCRTLPVPMVEYQNIRVSLIAPAFERHELNAGGEYEFALSRIDKLVNLYNSSDPVLKRFRFIDDGSPVAAGFLGLSALGNGARNDSSLASHPTFSNSIAHDRQVGRTWKSSTIATAPRLKIRYKTFWVLNRSSSCPTEALCSTMDSVKRICCAQTSAASHVVLKCS